MDSHRVVTLAERPDLEPEMARLHVGAWPTFLRQNQNFGALLDATHTKFASFQFLFLGSDGRPFACGNTVPTRWNGRRDDLPVDMIDMARRGLERSDEGSHDALGAVAAVVSAERQREGWSRRILETMRGAAARASFDALIAPVRPTRKSAYPLIPIERYASWTMEDGAPFDPWMRVHWRLGARVLAPAPKALVIEGSVAEWSEWTGMEFPETGSYVVPGALQPVEIDREWNRGVYDDPNVWMLHLVAKEGT